MIETIWRIGCIAILSLAVVVALTVGFYSINRFLRKYFGLEEHSVVDDLNTWSWYQQ